MIVRMCELAAYPEAHDDLVRWACEAAVPQLERHLGHISSEVFTSTDHRVVVISRWRTAPESLPDPPEHWVRRAVHAWDFSPVDR